MVSMHVGSIAIYAGWISLELLGAYFTYRIWGSKFVGDGPLWTSALCAFNQLLIFPLIFILSWNSRDFSLEWFDTPWDDESSSTHLFDNVWVLVFPSYFLFDFFVSKLGGLMILHHIACCAAHFMCYFALSKGFSLYFAGGVTLELGSGFLGLSRLYPENDILNYYALFPSMLISNSLAFAICIFWALEQSYISVKVVGLFVGLTFVILRQKEAFCLTKEYIEKGIMPPSTPRSSINFEMLDVNSPERELQEIPKDIP